MNRLLQDLRYAARLLARSPGFTAVSTLTLAVGIAFVTVLFGLADAFFLRPLPFAAPERLVHVWQTDTALDATTLRVSVPNFEDWRRLESFEDAGGYFYTSFTATTGDTSRPVEPGGAGAVQAQGTLMTPNLMTVLGVAPLAGRPFDDTDAVPGAAPVIALSDRGLRRFFPGVAAGAVLGSTVTLDGTPHTVIGVMAPHFVFPFNAMELYKPLAVEPYREDRGTNGPLLVVGRLRSGRSPIDAQIELDTVMRRLAAEHPETNATKGAHVVDLRSVLLFTYDTFRVAFPALFLAVAFVLLIACANIGNLLLARATGRAREIAFRLTLGATRSRLVRQLATESLLLAWLGGALGTAIALPLARGLEQALPAELYRVGEVAVDGRALSFAFLVACVCALAFGMLPALQTTRPQLAEVLAEGGRGSSAGRGARRWRAALVVVQVALAVLLVTGAALMAKTFTALRSVDLGFDAERLLTAELVLPTGKYADAAARNRFFDELVARVAALPGVEAATAAYPLQLNHEQLGGPIEVEGREPVVAGSGTEQPSASTFWVMPGYFEALGVPLVEGRGFGAQDSEGALPVVLVNRTLADRYWPGESALGRRLRIDDEWRTVVGVAADSVAFDLDQPTPDLVYYPQAQETTRRRFLFVRAAGEPVALAGAVRAAIAELDPQQPVVQVRAMDEVVWTWLGPWLMAIGGIGFLGLGALLLASLGLYGVLSYSVSQRTRELGIRSALGAARGDLVGLVLRDGLSLTAVGLVVGTAAALALTRFLGSLLFGVGALDAGTFALVPPVLLAVALLASWLPARRALRVEATEALRHQ